MTIASEIQRIKTNIANAYDALENKGATMPATEDSANLASTVATVSTGGTIESLSITPSTSAQTITATGGVDGYSPINVSAVTSSIDANIVAGNIKDGVSILGVTGTLTSGDEITATNTTGSAIASGDRIWFREERTDDPKYTSIGSIAVSRGIMFAESTYSGCYLELPTAYEEVTYVIKLAYVTRKTATAAQFLSSSTAVNSGGGIALLQENNTMSLNAPIMGGYLRDANVFASEEPFYVRVVINNSGIRFATSSDGKYWNAENTTFWKLEYPHIHLGENFILGSVNPDSFYWYLTESYALIDGERYDFMNILKTYSIINDTDITSTSFTGVAQESIANNATGSVKTLLDGNGTYAPTTATKSITTNGTYTASAENAYGLSEVTVNVPTPDTWYNWKTDVLTDVSAGTLGSSYNRVIYGNGVYVATPLNGSTVSYSSNGTTWNSATLPSSATNIRDGVYGNEFVVITDSGTCFVSADGTTWTQSQISSTITSGWGSIAFGNGKYIAIKNDGLSTNAATTSDGLTWTDITLPANKWWQKIAYGNGVFIVCCGTYYGEQNTIAYSTDGNTWNIVNLPYNASWTLLTYGDSQGFMVFGDNRGTKYAYKSVDGITWTQISNPGFYTDDFNVTYGNGFYVGSIGSVFYYSQDGNNWSTFNAISRPGAIAFDGTNFITGVYNTNYSNGNIFYLGERECYTLTASPTTSTQVYEIPKKTSALTITAVGTGTITLSDSKVYNRNSAGDVQSPVLGTKTITSNNTYTAASDYLDGFSSVTVDVPSSSGVGITREISAQGVYQMPTENFTFSLPSNATDVGDYGLAGAFNGCTGLTSLHLSSLTTISGNFGLTSAFNGCTSLTSVDLSSLTTISGRNGLGSAFNGCTSLTSVDLSSLTTISGDYGLAGAFQNCSGLTSLHLSSLTTISGRNGLDSAFNGCTSLTSVDLSSLTTISGNFGLTSAFSGCTALTSVDLSALITVSGSAVFTMAFYGCTGLTDIYFRALTTTSFGSYKNQFGSMLSSTGTTTTHTLHFPSNLQTTISGLPGYPNFGGIQGYVTCLFDLPATS